MQEDNLIYEKGTPGYDLQQIIEISKQIIPLVANDEYLAQYKKQVEELQKVYIQPIDDNEALQKEYYEYLNYLTKPYEKDVAHSNNAGNKGDSTYKPPVAPKFFHIYQELLDKNKEILEKIKADEKTNEKPSLSQYGYQLEPEKVAKIQEEKTITIECTIAEAAEKLSTEIFNAYKFPKKEGLSIKGKIQEDLVKQIETIRNQHTATKIQKTQIVQIIDGSKQTFNTKKTGESLPKDEFAKKDCTITFNPRTGTASLQSDSLLVKGINEEYDDIAPITGIKGVGSPIIYEESKKVASLASDVSSILGIEEEPESITYKTKYLIDVVDGESRNRTQHYVQVVTDSIRGGKETKEIEVDANFNLQSEPIQTTIQAPIDVIKEIKKKLGLEKKEFRRKVTVPFPTEKDGEIKVYQIRSKVTMEDGNENRKTALYNTYYAEYNNKRVYLDKENGYAPRGDVIDMNKLQEQESHFVEELRSSIIHHKKQPQRTEEEIQRIEQLKAEFDIKHPVNDNLLRQSSYMIPRKKEIVEDKEIPQNLYQSLSSIKSKEAPSKADVNAWKATNNKQQDEKRRIELAKAEEERLIELKKTENTHKETLQAYLLPAIASNEMFYKLQTANKTLLDGMEKAEEYRKFCEENNIEVDNALINEIASKQQHVAGLIETQKNKEIRDISTKLGSIQEPQTRATLTEKLQISRINLNLLQNAQHSVELYDLQEQFPDIASRIDRTKQQVKQHENDIERERIEVIKKESLLSSISSIDNTDYKEILQEKVNDARNWDAITNDVSQYSAYKSELKSLTESSKIRFTQSQTQYNSTNRLEDALNSQNIQLQYWKDIQELQKSYQSKLHFITITDDTITSKISEKEKKVEGIVEKLNAESDQKVSVSSENAYKKILSKKLSEGVPSMVIKRQESLYDSYIKNRDQIANEFKAEKERLMKSLKEFQDHVQDPSTKFYKENHGKMATILKAQTDNTNLAILLAERKMYKLLEKNDSIYSTLTKNAYFKPDETFIKAGLYATSLSKINQNICKTLLDVNSSHEAITTEKMNKCSDILDKMAALEDKYIEKYKNQFGHAGTKEKRYEGGIVTFFREDVVDHINKANSRIGLDNTASLHGIDINKLRQSSIMKLQNNLSAIKEKEEERISSKMPQKAAFNNWVR